LVVATNYTLSAAALLVGLSMLGCESDPAGSGSGSGSEDDSSVTFDMSSDSAIPIDLGADPEPGDSEEPDPGPPDSAGDPPLCEGSVNACNGCAVLEHQPDDPCGTCEDGQYRCQGVDAVRCEGAVLEPTDFWWDDDRDGYGRPGDAESHCTAPSTFWAPNDEDCNDGNRHIFPGAREICNGENDDCDDETDEAPDGEDCDDACCHPLRVCQEGRCIVACETERCGPTLDLCCTDDEICWGEECVEPGSDCEFTEDCLPSELCETSLDLCLPRSLVEVCEYRPPVGDFEPHVDCRWTTAGLDVNTGRGDVVGAPIVVNLTDDNSDGVTDRNDIPDIVFLTYNYGSDGCCNVRATLRIVSGLCNDDGSMNTLASINSPAMNNDTGIAAGDLDGDGVPEIVVLGYYGRGGISPGGMVAFRRVTSDGSEWEEYWHNDTYPIWDVHTLGGAAIAIADLEGDNDPEVVCGNVVLDGQSGTLKWDGVVTSDGTGGIGNNAFLGPASALADVDLDNRLELMAGNTLYEDNGDVAWTFEYTTSNSTCQGGLPCDGFSAFGNFDDDDFGEIVIVRLGEIFVLEHDGELLWRQPIPRGSCPYNESGPPTVADFDGDGFPEIGTASADWYVVADMECDVTEVPEHCSDRGILWKVPNQDCSSRVTASSVFDFEGDGAAEVIYADETTFRIFDGATGAILFEDRTHGSHTRLEMPVIADVDNDGNAEIVIPENSYGDGRPGIEVWSDASDNWVRTRRIWNQHPYSVTNITEDGAVPERPEINWLNPRYNNFRQNVQPAGLFDAPDLVLIRFELLDDDCPPTLGITVANEGALSVPEGMAVRVEWLDGDEVIEIVTLETTVRLFPGDSETLEYLLEPPPDVEITAADLRATVDPDETVNECDEDNNSMTFVEVTCTPK
jgi:hypothetical protein